MPALGHRGYVGIATETAWGNGTPDASGWQFIAVENESIKGVQKKLIVPGIRASREAKRLVQLGQVASGAFTWPVDPEDGIGLLLKNILPTEVTTDHGSGNGGTHLFSPGDSALPVGMTFLSSRDTTVDATNIWQAVGGRIKKLQFSAAEGAMLKCTADMDYQQSQDAATGQSPSYTTQNPFVYHQGAFSIGGSPANCKGFTLDVDSGLLVGRGTLGSKFSQQQQPLMYKISGTCDLYFDSMTEVNDFMNGTDRSLQLNFLGTAVGSSTRQLEFILPTVQWFSEQPSIAGPGEIMLKMTWTAYRPGSGSPDALIQIQLLNSRRTAY